LQFLSATNGANTIHFGDGSSADAYRGYINYNHTGDRMEFATSGTERMRIDSSGAVGIGQVPETARFSGHDILQVGGRATFLGNDTVTSTGQTALLDNLYYDASGNFQHRGDARGVAMQFVEGKVIFSNSNQTTGTPTVTPRMTLDNDGNLLVGSTSVGTKTGDGIVGVGAAGAVISNWNSSVAHNGTLDIAINTPGGGYQGFLSVSNTNVGNAGSRTQSTFSVFGRSTDSSIQQIATDTGSTSAASFSVTTPSNGVIRVTNTSGGTCSISMQFFGGTSG
jgi:hypothetical protein